MVVFRATIIFAVERTCFCGVELIICDELICDFRSRVVYGVIVWRIFERNRYVFFTLSVSETGLIFVGFQVSNNTLKFSVAINRGI